MALLKMMASRSGDNISPALLDFTARKLAAIGDDERVCAALEALLETGRRFPTVGEVKELLGLKPPSPDDKGREVADRIYFALSKPWKVKRRDDYVGPIGVEIVNLNGGWARLGENVMEAEARRSTRRSGARWRSSSLARAVSARRRSSRSSAHT